MRPVIKPTTLETVTVIISPQRVQCCWLKQTDHTISIQTTRTYQFPIMVAFAQPTAIEDAIRSFIQTHFIADAFVCMAVEHKNLEDALKEHHVLQCQLLAINTPFHCAGITSYQEALTLAQESATILPLTPADMQHQDLLCHAGLYHMVHSI